MKVAFSAILERRGDLMTAKNRHPVTLSCLIL